MKPLGSHNYNNYIKNAADRFKNFKFQFSRNLLLNIYSYPVDKVYITVLPFLMLEFYVTYTLYYKAFSH